MKSVFNVIIFYVIFSQNLQNCIPIEVILHQNNKQKSTINQSMKSNSSLNLKGHFRYEDFQIIKVVGEGAFGKVQLVKLKGRSYALKIIQKRNLAKQGKQYQAFVERQILTRLCHPGMIKLYTCFQDNKNLYFLLEYCQNGNLDQLIMTSRHKLSNEKKIHLTAEIVSTLQYFNSINIVHRDLKPQNILLTTDMHIKIVDFGTTEFGQCNLVSDNFKNQMEKKKNPSLYLLQIQKQQLEIERSKSGQSSQGTQFIFPLCDSVRKRKATFVGTCYYVSPELLEEQVCGPATDLWALGCIIYELFYGYPPFDGNSQYQIFEKIKVAQIQFPQNQYVPQQAKDLIKRLLVKSPCQRLGSNCSIGLQFNDLKSHPYFAGVEWNNIFSLNIALIKGLQNQEINHKKKNCSQIQKSNTTESILSLYRKDKVKQNIIFEGVIQKRTFIAYNQYYLALFKDLSIFRLKISEPQKIRQTSIPLYLNNNPAEIIDQTIFSLTTKQKVYKFKTKNAKQWVNIINQQFHDIRKQRNIEQQIQKIRNMTTLSMYSGIDSQTEQQTGDNIEKSQIKTQEIKTPFMKAQKINLEI